MVQAVRHDLSPMSPFPRKKFKGKDILDETTVNLEEGEVEPEEERTFFDYYQYKHNMTVSLNQPLLQVSDCMV